MNLTTRNAIILLLTIGVCVLVQQTFVPLAKVLPPLLVRFVLGWGLAITVGVVCSLLLDGSRGNRFLMLLCVPIAWLLVYFVFIGVDASARKALVLYVLYSTGFMLIGFVLAEWYRHSSNVMRR